MRPLYRIVETDNFGGDYPDEKFVNIPMSTRREDMQHIADAINSVFCNRPYPSPRYWRVVENGYKLVPGFEPCMIYPRHITLLSLKCPDHLPNSAVDDDPVHSPTNNERAQWVFTALQHFAGSTRQDIGEELDDVLCDFLCDLGHMCDRTGSSLQGAWRRAQGHYDAETRGKGRQF